MPNDLDKNGWDTYKRLVMSKLEDIGDRLDSIDKRLAGLELDSAMMKVKLGIRGVLGGCIPAGIAVLVVLLKG